MTRAPGIVAAALALLAGAARADVSPPPTPPAPADDAPGLARSLSVQAAPTPQQPPATSDPPADPALSLKQLPLDSRTNLLLYVGNHVPGALTVEGGISIHGAEARETALFIDDARTTRLVLPLGMLDRLSVLTAGYGAALADVTGGAIAASTAGETRGLTLDVGHAREMGRHNDDVTSVAVGAPLVGDRLFLRVAAELQLERLDGVHDASGLFPAGPDPTQRTLRGATKLIWLPRAGHRLELLGAGSFSRQDNTATPGIDREAQPRYEASDLALSARWAGTLGRTLRGRAQLYGERNGQREQPLGCAGDAQCGQVPTLQVFPQQSLFGNWTRDSDVVQRAIELVAALETPLPGPGWLSPSLRFTTRTRASDQRSAWSVPGDRVLMLNGTVPARETRYYANDPRLAEPALGPARGSASAVHAIQSLEAPLSLWSRVQLVPGLALVGARARTSRGDLLRETALAPGLSANWLVVRRLPVFLRASSVRRVDANLDVLIGNSVTAPPSRSCVWNADSNAFDRECTFGGGPSGWSLGLPCSPTGVDAAGAPCRGTVRLPRSRENTVGFGVIPLPWLRADFDLVHRRSEGLWRVAETNRRWNQAGTALELTGYKTGRPETVTDVSTPDSAQRRHRSVHTTVYATPGPVLVTLAHVHSRNSFSSSQIDGLDPAQWYDDEGRHFIYGAVAADLRGYFSIGALYTHAQGAVYARRYRNNVTDVRNQRGINPGVNINDPAPASVLRLPDTQQLSVQVRARGRRLLGIDADLFLDMMQVLAVRRATVSADDSSSFAQAAPSGPDAWYRLGLEYRY